MRLTSAAPATLVRIALVAVPAAALALGGCGLPSVIPGPLVTPDAAVAAVTHHWDINRQALRATSAARAKQLIEQVESGDALRMDEAVITREADARGTGGAPRPAIPGATGVRVFVPRQTTYPVVFLSVRNQAQSDPSGAPTGKSVQVLEVFRRASAAEAWRNTGYAEIAPGLEAKLDIAVDREGYATFADGAPGGHDLSVIYTTYMAALLSGHPAPADKRVLAGPLTDQFVAQLQHALAQLPGVKGVASFSASSSQTGLMLKSNAGGRFVIFDNQYDLATTPLTGGCITAGPGSGAPGSYASVTQHLLQNVGALVAPGAAGSVAIVAESDSAVGVDTRPCASGGTPV